MIESYGSALDSEHFVDAFRFVLTQGGRDGPHLKDLFEFTSLFVNEKYRKMRFQAYHHVARYPMDFPLIRNANMKWAWQQNTKFGWCPCLVSLEFRFEPDGKHSMCDFFEELEECLAVLKKVGLAVAKGFDQKKRIAWQELTEIELLSYIYGCKKVDGAEFGGSD